MLELYEVILNAKIKLSLDAGWTGGEGESGPNVSVSVSQPPPTVWAIWKTTDSFVDTAFGAVEQSSSSVRSLL